MEYSEKPCFGLNNKKSKFLDNINSFYNKLNALFVPFSLTLRHSSKIEINFKKN